MLSIPLILLAACGSAAVREKDPQTVSFVDIPRFMGDWYVIAAIPTYPEKDAVNAVESYSWNQEQERIDVDYHHNEKTADGKLKKYPQKAWVYDQKTHAEWRVRPIWPLSLAYLIIDLAPDYSTTMIGVPNKKHVWIMARKKQISAEIYDRMVKKAADMGYNVADLRKVPQS